MKKVMVLLVVLVLCASIMIGCGTTTTAPATSAPTSAAPAPTSAAPAPTSAAPAPTSAAPAPTSAKPAATTPQYGGILKWGSAGAPSTPIGWKPDSWGGVCCYAMPYGLQFLLKETADGTILPYVAESYVLDTKDPKNISISFKLRKGVYFSDGSELTSKVLKFDIEKAKTGTYDTQNFLVMKSIECPDDYTLKIGYSAWRNQDLRVWADCGTFFASQESYEKKGLEYVKWHMVGTGPFIQTDWQKDVILKVRRSDNYWEKGKPYLDGIDMIYVTDETTRRALFESGGCDVMDSNSRNASELKAKGYTVLTKQAGPAALMPDSANEKSPWSNLKVRQAAEYAIDKAAIAKAFGYGFSDAVYQFAVPSLKSYDPNFAGERKYDPAKAKALLAEAGYPSGFKTEIHCGSSQMDTAVTVKSYLDAVGIQTSVSLEDAAKLSAMGVGPTAGWSGLYYTGFNHWPNYNVQLNFFFGANSAWYKNVKRPDGWTDIVTATVNSVEQDVTLQKKATRALYDDCTFINLTAGKSTIVVNKKVHDTGYSERGSCYWNPEYAWMSK